MTTTPTSQIAPGFFPRPAGQIARVAPLRISDAAPTYERTDDHGIYAERRVYVGADAVALLRAAGGSVDDRAADTLAIRVSQIADYDADNPVTGDECSPVSLAVVAPSYVRNALPTDWTRDGWVDDHKTPALDADRVASLYRDGGESYSTDSAALALRALSLSGARGIHTVSLCSHSGEWLSWAWLGSTNGYVPGHRADEIGDALAWVPADVIAENYRTDTGGRVTYSPELGWRDADLFDHSAAVQAWASKIVHETVDYWDTYVRGEVYGVEVEITTELDDDERAHLDDQDDELVVWRHDWALWGIYGDDADPTNARGDDYAIVDQLGEVWHAVSAAADARAGAARRLEIGGTYVI